MWVLHTHSPPIIFLHMSIPTWSCCPQKELMSWVPHKQQNNSDRAYSALNSTTWCWTLLSIQCGIWAHLGRLIPACGSQCLYLCLTCVSGLSFLGEGAVKVLNGNSILIPRADWWHWGILSRGRSAKCISHTERSAIKSGFLVTRAVFLFRFSIILRSRWHWMYRLPAESQFFFSFSFQLIFNFQSFHF